MTIKIEMLRCFSIVARTGNLSDAAARLGRTPSAVSMTLKQLESHLGQRLFESERKNRLTPLGEEIFELAQHQIRQFDETLRTIETTAAAPLGLLRIASVPSVASIHLADAVDRLARGHPGLKVELRDTDTSQIIDALSHGRADIGIVSGRPVLTGVHRETLFEDAFGLVCAADHPLIAAAQDPDIAAVLRQGFVRNNLCDLITSPEIRDSLATASITAHNTLSLINLVRSGRWVTLLPETVVRIMPGMLAYRPVRGLTDRRTVSLLIRERSKVQMQAQEFARHLRDAVGR